MGRKYAQRVGLAAALGLGPGDRIRYLILDGGEVRLLRTRPVSELAGVLRRDGPVVSLDEMDAAIAGAASEA